MDIIRYITKGIDHNRWTVILTMLGIVMFSFILALPGCQSKTVGIVGGEQVTRAGLTQQANELEQSFAVRRISIEEQVSILNAEIESANVKLDTANAELDRQDAVKAKVLEFAVNFGGGLLTGNVTPADTIPAALTLLTTMGAGGLWADNKRKDKIITEKKAAQNA